MINFKERLLKEKEFHAGSFILQNEIPQMTEKEAIIILTYYNDWRNGEDIEMPNTKLITKAINTIVQEYFKRNL